MEGSIHKEEVGRIIFSRKSTLKALPIFTVQLETRTVLFYLINFFKLQRKWGTWKIEILGEAMTLNEGNSCQELH